MTRPARIIVWTFATLATLLAILVVVIATFDWNRVKPLLNEKVSEALHRPFAINGTSPCTGAPNPRRVAGVPSCPGRTSPPKTSPWATPNGSRSRAWWAWSEWIFAWRRCR